MIMLKPAYVILHGKLQKIKNTTLGVLSGKTKTQHVTPCKIKVTEKHQPKGWGKKKRQINLREVFVLNLSLLISPKPRSSTFSTIVSHANKSLP